MSSPRLSFIVEGCVDGTDIDDVAKSCLCPSFGAMVEDTEGERYVGDVTVSQKFKICTDRCERDGGACGPNNF